MGVSKGERWISSQALSGSLRLMYRLLWHHETGRAPSVPRAASFRVTGVPEWLCDVFSFLHLGRTGVLARRAETVGRQTGTLSRQNLSQATRYG